MRLLQKHLLIFTMLTNKKEYKKGSVALTSVIIITAILMFGGITAVISSLDVTNATVNNVYIEKAKVLGGTCFQESLHRVKTLPEFTGDVTFTDIDGNTCTSTVSDNVTPDLKDINTTSTYNDHTYSFLKRVDISSDPFMIID